MKKNDEKMKCINESKHNLDSTFNSKLSRSRNRTHLILIENMINEK